MPDGNKPDVCPPDAILPGLYILATPIGNLDDISLRALSLLKHADHVYAEDTRKTQILLKAHGIRRRTGSYHDHNGAQMRPGLLKILGEGHSVALVSDAGTPLICDPGLKLVREAIAAGIDVYPVPGPSALLAGLVASGLASDRFLFAGFPPPKSGARRRFLTELIPVQATLIFYEGPSRLIESLADMAGCFGPREAVLAREMTKLYEACLRAPLPELATHIADTGVPRGELVILVGPPAKASERVTNLHDQKFADLLRLVDPACPLRERAAIIAAETGRPRREVYARLVKEQSRSSLPRTDRKKDVLPGRRVRQRRYRAGRLAEYAARGLLMLKGYQILAVRVRNGAGEIDLIARKGVLLAFVEIKSRASLDLALEAVTPRARARIIRAAEIWVARHPRLAGLEQRFDIIAMRGVWPLAHLADAWRCQDL